MTPGLPIFDYQAMPAHRDDDCSEAAAKKVRRSRRDAHVQIGMVLARGPMTGEEIAFATGFDILYVRPRLREMTLSNIIEKDGTTGVSRSGGKSNCWRLKR